MSILLARPAATDAPSYCPYPLTADPRRFGLSTSTMRLRGGAVVVRHGRRTGSDTATIMLHGAAGSWTTWTPLLRAADASDAGPLTDLVLPDLPGWGDSTHLGGDDLSIEAMAALVAEITESLGYRRWTVIGHSMGGFIALELASSYRRETTSVGLVSATTHAMIDSVRHPLATLRILPGFTALLEVMRVLGPLGRFGTALVRGFDRLALLRMLAAPLFRRVRAIDPSVISALAAEIRPARFAAAAALAGTYDARAAWSRIRCPVRGIRGDADVFVADTDAAGLNRVLRDFAQHTLPGTGHFGHIERPADTLRLLRPL